MAGGERSVLGSPAGDPNLTWNNRQVADVPRDKRGKALQLYDRVQAGEESVRKGRKATVTRVYPDSAGCIDIRVLFDGDSEEEPVHGSCVELLPKVERTRDFTVTASVEVVIIALLRRIHGLTAPGPARVSFTENELARAEQVHLGRRGDGHRLELWVIGDT